MQVSRWGNSLAVRLPKAVVEALKLAPGDRLEIKATAEGAVTLVRDDRRRQAVERMRQRRWRLPEGYVFDRDEANAR